MPSPKFPAQDFFQPPDSSLVICRISSFLYSCQFFALFLLRFGQIKMSSTVSVPLRMVSRQVRLASRPSRTFVSASKSKPAPASTASRPAAAATSRTSSRPATSGTVSRTPPAAAPRPAPAVKAATGPTSPPAGAPGSHTPVPQVSGEPLPDVPSAARNDPTGAPIDWSSSFHGLGTADFGPDVAQMLQAPLEADDIEVKPDGILYLPEIKYRRVLNAAFGPGGWGLAPRGDLHVQDRLVYRDYALIAHGR